MNVHFNCTQCGKCCHGSKIPLTVAEAIKWLNRSHEVQLLCEASPWPVALDSEPRASHFKRKSFAAMSGSMPTRVVAMLLANVVGPCPNLLADNRCGIYQDRPLVCRVYPAEINPFVVFEREKKACPPEAWSADQSLPPRGGNLINEETLKAIQASQDADASEADIKRRLCLALNVVDTALVHEAALLYSPTGEDLLSGLAFAIATDSEPAEMTQWRFVSDQADTLASLSASGGIALHVREAAQGTYRHHGFKREAIFSYLRGTE